MIAINSVADIPAIQMIGNATKFYCLSLQPFDVGFFPVLIAVIT